MWPRSNNKEVLFNKGLHRHKSMNMEMTKEEVGGELKIRVNTNIASRRVTYYYSCNSLGSCGVIKWIYLFLLLLITLSLNIDSTLASCYPPRIKHGKVQVKEPAYNGVYSNNSQALVSCDAGFHLKSGETIYCLNARWIASDKSAVKEDQLCEQSNEERCDSPPDISHGFYRSPHSYYGGSGETDFAVGTELQAACEPSFALNCPHQKSCGRIVCSAKGNWVPKDANLINCAAVPQTVVSGNSRDTRSDDVHGFRNTSSTQNYLILALAMVCIVGVAALTIALLRRPLFCKKRDQSPSDPHVMVTSSSPHHGGYPCEDMDNSIPVAMNSGIFVPGAEYNLQNYHLQDGPLCGTQVFK